MKKKTTNKQRKANENKKQTKNKEKTNKQASKNKTKHLPPYLCIGWIGPIGYRLPKLGEERGGCHLPGGIYLFLLMLLKISVLCTWNFLCMLLRPDPSKSHIPRIFASILKIGPSGPSIWCKKKGHWYMIESSGARVETFIPIRYRQNEKDCRLFKKHNSWECFPFLGRRVLE